MIRFARITQPSRKNMKKKIFREERLRMIMGNIYDQEKVVVHDLARQFGRSSSSIRLDLAELESRGLIVRTHGGALLADGAADDLILTKKFLQLRTESNREEKQRIGEAAVELIHDGDSIMMDGGSTTYFVAKNLRKKRGLTIITTSISLLPLLLEIADAKIFLTGGMVYRDFEDTIGEISLESIRRFKPDHTIIGIDGISLEQGLTSTEPTIAPLKRQMVAESKDLIVVSDSSKFGKVCVLSVAELKEVSTIVTDKQVSEEWVEKLRSLGPLLIRA